MKKVNRSALMPYSAQQMFNVVNGIEQYPEFLPWCASSQIIQQSENMMEASILMKKGKLNHSFTTRNTLVPDQKIQVDLVNGPFKYLSGHWTFTSISEQGSKIELNLEFEFSNSIIGFLIGPVFTQIANTLVDAFCQRAHQLYRS